MASAAPAIPPIAGPRAGCRSSSAPSASKVRAEPVEMPYWEPRAASLIVTGAEGAQRTSPASRCPSPLPARSKPISSPSTKSQPTLRAEPSRSAMRR